MLYEVELQASCNIGKGSVSSTVLKSVECFGTRNQIDMAVRCVGGVSFFYIMERIAKLLGYIYIFTVLNIVDAAEVQQDLQKDWLSIYIEPFTVSHR